ncbi:hypothetical protein MAR_005440 [Mya arenaria]|uniref:Uncharacterized protein n=1 Tax=Mya arenaria TaxID=6604 RepID=A0ABY7EZJ6_MYAAR|nr:hypothetical protein MAR_005440 [Mya arenaria]
MRLIDFDLLRIYINDIRTSRVKMFDALNAPPTPRFMTLQKNYWAMVKSQVPMWEEDIGMSHPNTSRSTPAVE